MSYRLGDKIRHRNILSLGRLEELTHYQDFKFLADRIEQLVSSKQSLLPIDNQAIEPLAQFFYQQIIDKKLLHLAPVSETVKTFHPVDLARVAVGNAREIGCEWLCRQALEQLDMRECLEQAGFKGEDTDLALAHIISRAVFPASHATAEWMKDNSGVCELMGIDANKVSHHKLYRISSMLSKEQERIETYLSHKTNELFDLMDKIILYDLTNSYFIITTTIKSKAVLFYFVNPIIFNDIMDYFIKTAFDNNSILQGSSAFL